jgi:hypothetical protein
MWVSIVFLENCGHMVDATRDLHGVANASFSLTRDFQYLFYFPFPRGQAQKWKPIGWSLERNVSAAFTRVT